MGRAGGAVARAARSAGLDVHAAGRDDAAEVAARVPLVLIAVPDAAIEQACEAIAPSLAEDARVGHLSGARGLDALAAAARAGAATFSLHPLQTLPDDGAELAGAWAAIDGSDDEARAEARRLASELGMRPFMVPASARSAYHAAAAIGSNLLVALEESAVELMGRAGVEEARAALTPLVLRAAANWADRGAAALTGPIARGDEAVVGAHREAIAGLAPELLPLYDALSDRARRLAGNDSKRTAGPRVIRTRAELRAALEPARRDGRTIGLVPTMGSLHAGHRSLLAAARERCDVVVMSLFVNPTQFGPSEDLDAYPRDEAGDLAAAAAERVDLVYAPAVEEVYPDGFATSVTVRGGLTDVLCGDPTRRGPAHFDGVTTVVAKLLAGIGPDVAFFGQKDAQQAIVIRRMVRDLELPVRIETMPTVREPDGLAMSSRNAYLSPADRERAPALRRALLAAERTLERDRSVPAALAAAREVLDAAGIEPEYLEARDAENLKPDPDPRERSVLIALAARVGSARLIDNVLVAPPQGAPRADADDRYPRGGIGS
ncbi:pantoate--beta-alanine ligase [Thermoleophilia bacterium SCSIO 60948]|nr:pantoate--beta-alanine ligase [Thermoleophilia bacterium SCSIO 60948]